MLLLTTSRLLGKTVPRVPETIKYFVRSCIRSARFCSFKVMKGKSGRKSTKVGPKQTDHLLQHIETASSTGQDSTDMDTDAGVTSDTACNVSTLLPQVHPGAGETCPQSQNLTLAKDVADMNVGLQNEGTRSAVYLQPDVRPNSSIAMSHVTSPLFPIAGSSRPQNCDIPEVPGRKWNQQEMLDIANLKKSVAELSSTVRHLDDKLKVKAALYGESSTAILTPRKSSQTLVISRKKKKHSHITPSNCSNGEVHESISGSPPPTCRQSRMRCASTSSEDFQSENEFTSLEGSDSQKTMVRNIRQNHNHVKLPVFTGKESWNVWFNRFDAVASRHGWSHDQRLDELLPRLQGQAGEFVFDQLTRRTRESYKLLIGELKARFRVIETPKSFGSRFSRREQKSGESPEDYAADLKKLYDKAYARRDLTTRREDLLRKFLDGLQNETVSFQVEYIREPKDIDEAVFEVANFLQAKRYQSTERNSERTTERKNRFATREVRTVVTPDDLCAENLRQNSDFSDAEHDTEKIGRVSQRPIRSCDNQNKSLNNVKAEGKVTDKFQTSTVQPLVDALTRMEEKLEKLSLSREQPNNSRFQKPSDKSKQFACFSCGSTNHFIKDCPQNPNNTYGTTNKTETRTN